MIDSESNIIGSDTNRTTDLTVSQQKINFMVTDIFMMGGKSLISMDYKKKMYFTPSTVVHPFSKLGSSTRGQEA